MKRFTPEEQRSYLKFLRDLPRSPGLPIEIVPLIRALGDKAHEKDLIYQWLELDQVVELCLETGLKDVEGSLDKAKLLEVFKALFKRRELVVADQYEIITSQKPVDGKEQMKSLLSIRFCDENLRLIAKFQADLVQAADERECAAEAA